MLCPVTSQRENHFLHHFSLLQPSEEGNSCHILGWKVKETALKSGDEGLEAH